MIRCHTNCLGTWFGQMMTTDFFCFSYLDGTAGQKILKSPGQKTLSTEWK